MTSQSLRRIVSGSLALSGVMLASGAADLHAQGIEAVRVPHVVRP